MRITVNYAANGLLALTLLLASGRVNAQYQESSPEQSSATNAAQTPGAPAEGAATEGSSSSEGAQPGASQLTGDQRSAATKALCSALAGQYKDAAKAGISGLTDPKVLLTAATNYSSVMHVSVSSATSLLKGFAIQHGSEVLSSCAVNSATRGVSGALPSVGGVTSKVPGIGGMPAMPNT
jgi:hypothetical protein